MGFQLMVSDVIELGERTWAAALTPADVARLGSSRVAVGSRSIIGVTQPSFDQAKKILSFDPEAATVLNMGSASRAIIVELGEEPLRKAEPALPSVAAQLSLRNGDGAFLVECRRHLPAPLVNWVADVLAEIRRKYPGQLQEGLARKWVNSPANFVAFTIQPRDQSFAVHVKGSPAQFSATSLAIKPDRGSYSRFKVHGENAFEDAKAVIMASAHESQGY